MGDIEDFVSRVDELQNPDLRELAQLFDDLRGGHELADLRRAIAGWLLRSVNFAKLSALARETPTHYVWPIHRSKNGFHLVINEFKGREVVGEGYAKVLHNHRYSFASLMLAGRYTESRSAVMFSDTGHFVNCADERVTDVAAGDITLIGHDSFHRLVEIGDGTMTLLLKTPAWKLESVSIDLRTQRIVRHVPVETRVMQFVSALG